MRLLFLLGTGLFILLIAAVVWTYREFDRDLPSRLSEVTDYQPRRASRVFSHDGKLIGEFFLQKRIVLPASAFPQRVRNAFVAAEDNRFFSHHGVDPMGILRAAWANWRAGRIVQGGSTITQQVAKLILVGSERNFTRKIREALLAFKIEQELTKDQILAIYLNHAYLGHGAYGVEAAAEIYFGKTTGELTIGEAALLAGLPKAPTDYSPFSAYLQAKERQRYVLDQMEENKMIKHDEASRAKRAPVAIISRDRPVNHLAAPYFVEEVRKMVQQKYGGEELYDRGLRIHTTLRWTEQKAAEAALRHGLEEVERSRGFRGPVGHLHAGEAWQFTAASPQEFHGLGYTLQDTGASLVPEPDRPYFGLVEIERGRLWIWISTFRYRLTDVDAARIAKWAHGGKNLTAGDLIPVRLSPARGKANESFENQRLELAFQPETEGALVAVDQSSGAITALVGGYDYERSQFNRVTQARRQVGSSIKPYLYAAALEHGYTELSIVQDAPISVRTAAGLWSPHNYKPQFDGPVTLRTALQKSLNTVAVRLVLALGLDVVIETLGRFGIRSRLVRHPSLALGTAEMSLLEHTLGYGVFARGGESIAPLFIERVLDADGVTLEKNSGSARGVRVIEPGVAYIMTDLLKNVVDRGTGQKAKDIGRPAAGKTGTSNDYRDNWFIAYTRERLCGVWVGRDDFQPIGFESTGGLTAAPIWTAFLQNAHPPGPPRDFAIPDDVYFVRASPSTGAPATPGNDQAIQIPLLRGSLPSPFARGQQASKFSDEKF